MLKSGVLHGNCTNPRADTVEGRNKTDRGTDRRSARRISEAGGTKASFFDMEESDDSANEQTPRTFLPVGKKNAAAEKVKFETIQKKTKESCKAFIPRDKRRGWASDLFVVAIMDEELWTPNRANDGSSSILQCIAHSVDDASKYQT